MIEISVAMFLVLLEALFVAVALMVYWFMKARRVARQNAARHQAPAAPKVTDYLDQELQQTRARLKTADGSAAAGLKLRAAYLEFERGCAGQSRRDEPFWTALSERLLALGTSSRPSAADADAARVLAAKSVDTRALIESTAREIDKLKERVAHVVTDPQQGHELLEQIDQLGRVNRELADCVAVLEDENDLLRSRVPAPPKPA